MIAFLNGKIADLEATHVIIDCHGVGYLAKISLGTYKALQSTPQAKVFTYLQVREDAHILYGFAQKEEQKLFEQLISISGVGGNTALMMLSSLSPEELFGAISNGDATALQKIKGIGAKTAARIVLELKDKIQWEGELSQSSPGSRTPSNQKQQEAVQALTTLGLSKAAMEKRVAAILKAKPEMKVADVIKEALRNQ